MKNKKLLLFIIILIVIITLTIILIINNITSTSSTKNYMEKYANLPRNDILIDYLLNLADTEIAADVHPYIFIGKVNTMLRTEYRDPTKIELLPFGFPTKTIYHPYTIYDITVVQNLKGELATNTNITIEQKGGVDKNKKSVSFPGNSDFLKENCYYIFLATASSDTNELYLSSGFNIVELGTLSDNNIKEQVFDIAQIEDFNVIDKLYNEKNNEDTEINKVITYKHAVMTPIDLQKYKYMSGRLKVKESYKNTFFNTGVSKYDVNYKNYIHINDLLVNNDDVSIKNEDTIFGSDLSLFDVKDKDAIFNHSDYVIIGEIERIEKQYWDAEQKNTLTVGTIKVKKSFKGNLKKNSEISFIRDGGIIRINELENTIDDRERAILNGLSKEERIKMYGIDKFTEKEKSSLYVFDASINDIPIENNKIYLMYLNYNEDLQKYEIKYNQYGLKEIDTSKSVINYEDAQVKDNNTGNYVKLNSVLPNEVLNKNIINNLFFKILDIFIN